MTIISCFTSLFVLMLFKKLAVIAQSTTQLIGNFRTPMQREYTIQNILSSYKAAHNAAVLSLSGSSELCSRRFIVSTAACRDAGNGLGIFLDNLAWAVLLNRTIVLVWNKSTNFCENSTRVQDWIVRKEEMDTLLLAAGCPWRASYRAGVYRVGGRERAIRCCNVEGINATWLSPGSTAKHAHLLLQPRGGAARVVSTAVEHRFSLLFPTTRNSSTVVANSGSGGSTDREYTDREIASFETYGVLTAFALEFTSVTRALTEPILQSIYRDPQRPNPITIAMHIRHQRLNRTLERLIDDGMEVCLRHVLQTVRGRNRSVDLPCAILLATDRASTLIRMSQVIEGMNCSVHLVPRGMSRPEARGEHGPWGDSKLAIADLFLLGHADYFLGSQISSYSTLIANSIAARRMLRPSTGQQHGGEEDTFLWGMLVHRAIRNRDMVTQQQQQQGGHVPDQLPPYCAPYRDKGVEIRRSCSLSRNYYNYQTQRCELVDRKDGAR